MAYSVTLKRPRNKGLSSKTTNHVEINGEQLDSKAKVPAQRCYEKYIAMAHESMVSGDRIAAEGYYQHAEHYLRLMKESKPVILDADLTDDERNIQDKLLPLGHDALIEAQV